MKYTPLKPRTDKTVQAISIAMCSVVLYMIIFMRKK